MAIRHAHQSAKIDTADPLVVGKTKWNDDHVVGVKAAPYLAVGNGVADDTAAVLAAIAAEDDIFFPPGTYLLGQLTVPDGKRLYCSPGTVTLKPTGTFPGDHLIVIADVDRVEISGFIIDINLTTFPALKAFAIVNSTFVYIHDIDIAQIGVVAAINSAGCADCTVQRVRVVSPQYAAYFNGGSRIKLLDCSASDASIHSFQFDNCTDSVMARNFSIRSTVFGMNFFHCARCSMVENVSEDSHVEGLNFRDSSYCQMIGNSTAWAITTHNDFGISVSAQVPENEFSNHNVIMGNTVLMAAKSGIAIAENAQYNVVIGNTIVGGNLLGEAEGAGIILYDDNCFGNIVSENTIVQVGTQLKYGINEWDNGGVATNNQIVNNFIGAGMVTAPIGRSTDTVEALNKRVYESWTPVVTAGSGAITSYTAVGKFYQIEKIVYFYLTITITNNGSAAGHLIATLPFTLSANASVASGREKGITGAALTGQLAGASNQMTIFKYDNTYPGATNAIIDMSGFFERA